MNKDINKAIDRLIDLSATGCITGSYENNIVSINFKVANRFELRIIDDEYCFWYVTEINASPAEVKFKLSEIEKVEHYAEGEFEPCTCIELIRFIFKDDSTKDFYDDVR
jgi:hypothetical protein